MPPRGEAWAWSRVVAENFASSSGLQGNWSSHGSTKPRGWSARSCARARNQAPPEGRRSLGDGRAN
eukprot:6080003-Alexandrium_andersonii.AAC.1